MKQSVDTVRRIVDNYKELERKVHELEEGLNELVKSDMQDSVPHSILMNHYNEAKEKLNYYARKQFIPKPEMGDWIEK